MALPDGVTIRRGVPADAEVLAHLHLDVWDDAYTGLMPQEILDERRRKVDERIERWRGILGQDEPTWLAENAEGLVGFVSIGPTRDNDTDIPLQLFGLYVRAGYRGTGVGYALFEQAVGDRAPSLWVLANNERTISFYERQGFRLAGRLDEHDEGQHARIGAGRDAGILTTVMVSPTPRSAIVLANGVSRHVWRERSGRPGS
jgi:GNAT superfamily N-acetyltransferase